MPKRIPVMVRATAPATVEQTFHAAVPVDLTKIFTGFLFLPAVVEVRNQSGSWDHAGVSRNPVFSNGKGAFEQVTTYRPPTSFDYDVSKFTNILGRLVSGAHGSWTFSPDPSASGGPATVIEWIYSFAPLPLRRSIVRILIAPVWRAYMRRALALTVREVEKSVSSSTPA
jgi:hypothetical protein